MFPRGQRFCVRETNIASPTRFGQGERGGAKEAYPPKMYSFEGSRRPSGVPDSKGRPALLYTLAPPYLPSKGELLDEIERSRGRTAMRKSAVKAKAGR